MEKPDNDPTLLLDIAASRLLNSPQAVPVLDASGIEGLCYWSATEDHSTYFSPAFWGRLGFDATDVPALAAQWIALLFPEAASGVTPRNGTHPFDVTAPIEQKSGDRVQVRCAGIAIVEQGRPLRLVGQHRLVEDFGPPSFPLRDGPVDPALALEIEYRHRVRNLFALVQSIARLSARGSEDKDELLQQIEGRFAAISAAHSAEIASVARRTTSFNSLVTGVLAPFEDRALTLDLPDQDVGVTESLLTSCALFLHELAISAQFCGAWLEDDGQVSVCWTMGQEETGPIVTLEWCEAPPRPERPYSTSATLMSKMLIESSVDQLRGTYEEISDADRTRVILTFKPDR